MLSKLYLLLGGGLLLLRLPCRGCLLLARLGHYDCFASSSITS